MQCWCVVHCNKSPWWVKIHCRCTSSKFNNYRLECDACGLSRYMHRVSIIAQKGKRTNCRCFPLFFHMLCRFHSMLGGVIAMKTRPGVILLIMHWHSTVKLAMIIASIGDSSTEWSRRESRTYSVVENSAATITERKTLCVYERERWREGERERERERGRERGREREREEGGRWGWKRFSSQWSLHLHYCYTVVVIDNSHGVHK